jgi:hypothetical protein
VLSPSSLCHEGTRCLRGRRLEQLRAVPSLHHLGRDVDIDAVPGGGRGEANKLSVGAQTMPLALAQPGPAGMPTSGPKRVGQQRSGIEKHWSPSDA